MIVVRSPLRISLGGGGTDLPSYYERFEGFVLSAAIDRYVYITINERFDTRLSVRYSKMEVVDSAVEVEHPIVREALRMVNLERPHIDIASMADVPAGTGLGSSGSFTTALLRALYAYRRDFISPQRLARKACEIEIDILKEPIGKQDQYIAACGGITAFTFRSDGDVDVRTLDISDDTARELEEHLLLFYTGVARSASALLIDQDRKTKDSAESMLDNLHFIKKLGLESAEALQSGDFVAFSELMNVHWEHKRKRSPGMSTGPIDDLYNHARENGALGGKLIGAGGGGFLMFYADDKKRLRQAMADAGVREMRFRFDFSGTRIITDF
jgi:D-glycero-alpha-D-manno-heptose-7-phosphate kinase